MNYPLLVNEFYSHVWAMRPEKLLAIKGLVDMWASGVKLDETEVKARLEAEGISAASRARAATSPGTVALIPILGTISHRVNLMSNMSGGTSIEKLTSQFRTALADPNVKSIVFDVDSPGGSVDGVPELASEIYQGRQQKPIVAVANGSAASAAYWLASAADELVVTPSSQVGSIGVFCAHQDVSKALEAEGVSTTLISAGKYKTEGNPYGALDPAARAAMQDRVDSFYGMFVKAVAQGRSATQVSVREGFGEGRMVLAAAAVKENMADRVATLDEVLSKYGVTTQTPMQRMAAEQPARAMARRRRELELL